MCDWFSCGSVNNKKVRNYKLLIFNIKENIIRS